MLQPLPGIDVDEFHAIRVAEGLKIDPGTAEVTWTYAQTLYPYGIYEVTDEHWQVGREYFAKRPGSDIWVDFGDLPEKTSKALWQKHSRKLALWLPLYPEGINGDS